MKILRVCLSSELPAEYDRLSNYIYFCYDKLLLYNGSEKLSANFSLSEEMPESPVPNMIYILFDGTVRQYKDYSVTTLATIEEEEQIDLIKKAGTTYFINGDSRYINKQDRTLVLPFNNDVYQLVVDYNQQDTFDNDTIVKYNEETGQFELYSGQDKYIDYSRELHGTSTPTVTSEVNGSRLSARVRISQAFGNALKEVSDGLFVRTDNKVDKEKFDEFAFAYAVLDNLDEQIEYLSSIISAAAINTEIHEQLQSRYPEIDEALSNFDEIRAKLDAIESSAMGYASTTTANAINEIDQGLQKSSSWDNLNEDIQNYTHEVNYNDKAIAYDNELTTREKRILLGTAVAAFIMSELDPEYFADPIVTEPEVIVTPVNPTEETILTSQQIELILAASISAYIKSTHEEV